MVRMRRAICLAALLGAAAPALALTQPDGTVIPVDIPGDNLWDLFTSLGEPINPLTDAADVPETYSPSCQLTFTLLSRGTAEFQNAFGWYNVVDGGPPSNADLQVLLDCNAQPPTSVPLDIQQSGEFSGGQIGFFLITPQGTSSECASLTNVGHVYYSQKEYNPDDGLNVDGGSYIHLLTYDSKLHSNTYYFCWEDLFNGGDNEFKDLVAEVQGITCTGGGGPCNTGKLGICALGTEQCVDGQLTCVQQFQPQPEQCNGLDNDCNGVPGNGATCPNGQVCVDGACQAPCGGGEFGGTCPSGEQCVQGQCVDPACQNVTCPSGQTCQGGSCVDPCSGVTCPHGQQCAFGRCFDPCTAVACGQGEVCESGACQTSCACAGCPTGDVCQPDGSCVEAACASVTCAVGSYCSAGSCVDACAGAVCPAGGSCQAGQCQAASSTGGGTGAATGGSGGGTSGGAGTGGGATNGGSTGRGPTTGGSAADGGAGAAARTGCGCQGGMGGTGTEGLLLLAWVLFGVTRRTFDRTQSKN
jgi:hypothetical protein